MTPTDSPVYRLGDDDVVLRLTLPRLRDLENRTQKTLTDHMAMIGKLSTTSLVWLLWAAIAHPANPKYSRTTMEEIEGKFDLRRIRETINAVTACVRAAMPDVFPPQTEGDTENPPLPAVQEPIN